MLKYQANATGTDLQFLCLILFGYVNVEIGYGASNQPGDDVFAASEAYCVIDEASEEAGFRIVTHRCCSVALATHLLLRLGKNSRPHRDLGLASTRLRKRYWVHMCFDLFSVATKRVSMPRGMPTCEMSDPTYETHCRKPP